MRIALAGPIETESLARATGHNLLNWPLGTAQTPIVPLAAQFLKDGHSVHIVTIDPLVERPLTLCSGDLAVTFCPLRAPPRYKTRWRMLDLFSVEIGHIRSALLLAKPDIVHAHWTYEFAEAAIRTRLPHLVTMHDIGWDYLFHFRDLYRLMRLGMKYRAMPRVRRLSVVAPFMAQKARQYGYFGKVDVVPNGIEIPDPGVRPLMDFLAKPCLVTVGNTSRIKNVQASLAGFRRVRMLMPNVELHLFGPGLDASYTGGEPGVKGHGNVSNPELMSFLLHRATLLVHPSRLETFGVVLAEAKARGVPVVGSARAGGVPYVIGDNAGGLALDVDDPQLLGSAIIDLISDPRRYRSMSMRAVNDAADRFSIRTVANAYMSIYCQIIDMGHYS